MGEATDDLQTLADLAASLRPRVAPRKPLPRLLFVTDPDRTPDPVAVAARLPAGWGVIYRAFGRPNALETGLHLRKITRLNGLSLLVGADPELARAIEADGLHLPERLVGELATEAGWIVTAAAHSAKAITRAAGAGCDAVLVSPVFPSRSPSATQPLGRAAFTALVAASPLPVYALGGVNTKTAPELVGSGAAGFAMVEAVRT